MVVRPTDHGCLLPCWDFDGDELSGSLSLRLCPPALATDAEAEQVEGHAVGVLPRLGHRSLTTDKSGDGGSVGVVAVGDGVTEDGPDATVWQVTLYQEINR